MQVTYYGHSCFGIKIKDTHLLIDPFILGNPLAKNIQLENIPVDYLLISHAHSDHVGDALEIAYKTGATLIGVYEVMNWFQHKGIERVIKMNIGGNSDLGFGKIKLVNAVHTSKFSDGTFGGQPCGFYISSDDGNFYYAGDTALHYDMKLLGKYAKLDLAFLPLGNHYTMDVDDALIAAKFIKCDKIVGMHYDTFDELKIDKQKAVTKFADQDKKLFLMEIGEEKKFKIN